MTFSVADYNLAGQVYCAANVSAKSVIAVTTAMTGCVLYNPIGSGKKFVILDAGFVWTTVPGALHNLGLAVAKPNVTVPSSLTAIGSGIQKADGSGTSAESVAFAWDAATLPVAPVAVRWFGGAAWVTGASVGPYFMVDRVNGAIVLVPGAALAFTVVTTTAIGMASISWAEVPAT